MLDFELLRAFVAVVECGELVAERAAKQEAKDKPVDPRDYHGWSRIAANQHP